MALKSHKDLKLRIGLKYCGGCNPGYDRVAVAAYIKESLKDEVEFVAPDMGAIACILVVEGCETACVDLSHFKGVPIRVITRAEMAKDVVREIRRTVASGNLDSG